MHPFETVHIFVTDLSFSDYLYLDLSQKIGSDFTVPAASKQWIQIDLPLEVEAPAGFRKRLLFIEKIPQVHVVSPEIVPLSDVRQFKDLLFEQQAFHYQLDTEYFADPAVFEIDAYLVEIDEKLQDGTAAAYGVFEAGELLGFSVVELEDDGSAYLLELMVLEKVRGKGYGKSLLKSAETWAAERQVGRFWTSAAVGNESALHFYERQGFRPTKVRWAARSS
ncbi:GNAT family N-acetyltransferase [Candidatus Peregrinibacteria bacterium]|nr:MAG: GNAT family N-acetyltransferase [Candidatus Peregrinibacteria bacterium]